MRHTVFRALRAPLAALSIVCLLALGVGAATVPAAAAELPPSSVSIKKTNDLDGKALEPGGQFSYQLVAQCSGLTTDCVNFTVTDTLPDGLDVTSLPQSTSTRTVTYDEGSRKLTIMFQQPLQEPADAFGLRAGETGNLEIGMRLPPDTDIHDGTVITNTAQAIADNAPAKESSSDVTVSVPRVVTPVATKGWSDGSAVAGSGEASTVSLGIRNGSSSSAEVTSLTVTDDTAATYENFDLTSIDVTAFPKGADTAKVRVKTTGGYVDVATVTGTGQVAFPDGISPADVTAVQVVFSDGDGAVLPYDATGGTVELGLKLRDTKRSDGSPLRPTDKLVVNNCAEPGAADKSQGDVSGAGACKAYDVLPDTLVLSGVKDFFPDTNGNFSQDNGEHAVIGQNSPVTATVNVTNKSPFPVKTLTIAEPDGDSNSELGKVDISSARVRLPAGATAATLKVTYADGTGSTMDFTANATPDISKDGTQVTKVEVTYTGVDENGDPSIAPGSTSGLDLHGTLNDKVTDADLPDGSSPGIDNCAGFQGSAGRTDGTGTASGTACKNLTVEEPRTSSAGVKTAGQNSVPDGQPIPFTLKVSNNGNKPLVTPVITDPRVGTDGKPDPAFPNPFDSLRITAASVTQSGGAPASAIELYDPAASGGSWVPYDAGNAGLLERAQGVRATMAGNLNPTQQFTLNLVTERRDGVGNDVHILNCFSTGAGGDYTPGDPACAPQIDTAAQSDSASLNKSINPSTLPEFVPGLPKQFADVALSVFNSGNMSAKTLQVTDNDDAGSGGGDFFDAVDFTKIQKVVFPAGANRVTIDAFVGGQWIGGTPSATGALPASVTDPLTVRGLRATFSSTSTSNDGYVITPCAKASDCQGQLIFQVSPRQSLLSDPGSKVPAHLVDTATGSFLTQLQDPGSPKAIDPNNATLDLTKGAPKLAVSKTPDSAIGPGETAPFNLKVTNTGTANVPDLVVKDSLPKGIAFDDTFAGDNGQPFKVVAVQVPAGTPAVPAPVFTATNSGDRVSELRWDFGKTADGDPWYLAPGATLTIQIQAMLEPGVTAGQVINNTMGATSSAPELACDGTEDTDGPMFGPGPYCTDSAGLTAQAGAAFSARKWVSGNDSLGWYNTRTKASVDVGDKSCASATDAAGRAYTAYPCIAMVNPGDQYHYMMRLVNSGTEPGTDMRIVDRFPVAGDKGVILDQSRGTEWDHRPTLASEPSLSGPGELTTTYSDSEPICTDDLAMGGAGSNAQQCPGSAWDAPFGPAVVAAQMQLKFATPIQPGDKVDITFAMDTPLDVAQVSEPTIAWNSYAHAETTDRNGRPNVLPATEPIQVGVGLAYGSLDLQKAIGVHPDDLQLGDHVFPFQVKCVIHPQGREDQVALNRTYQVSPNQPMSVPGIPAGAECQVWETDADGGVSDHDAAHPLKVTIEPGADAASVQAAPIVNDFPDSVIALTKKVTGPAAKFAPDAFPVSLTCRFDGVVLDGFPRNVTLNPSQGRFEVKVPAGAECDASETKSGGATDTTYDPPSADGPATLSGEVTATDGAVQDLTITNDYKAGGIVVNKEVSGAGAPELAQGPFTFQADCSFNGVDHAVVEKVTIPKGDGTQTSFTSDAIAGLPAGAVCEVSEVDNGGADETPAPITVTVPADGNTVAGFTGDHANEFSADTIGLSKELTGPAGAESYATDATFTVQVTCQRDAKDEDGAAIRTTVFSQPVQIKGGQTIEALTGLDGEVVKLPVGTHCWGEETDAGGATAGTVDHDSFDNSVVVQKQADPSQLQALMIRATNDFEYSSLSLTKKVTGAAASYVGDRQFTVAVSCVFPQGGAEPTKLFTDKPYAIAAGQTVQIDKLPVGAQCWAQETDRGGATQVAVDHDSAQNAVATVGEGKAAPAAITLTNTFAAGELTVSKQVVNGLPGPYSFALACTTDQGPVALKKSDASFALKAGQKRVITVPLGAACAVTEAHVAQGDTVSFVDSDKKNDGEVTVNGAASVQVVNTFKAKPVSVDPAGGKGGDGLTRTGGVGSPLLFAGIALLLVSGLMLVILSRRRGAPSRR